MNKIILLALLVVISSCSFQNPTEENSNTSTGVFILNGETIEQSSANDLIYRQQLIIDLDNLEEYRLRIHTFSGNMAEEWETNAEGWYILDGKCWLQSPQLDFNFVIEDGKVLDAIEYIEIEYRDKDQQEGSVQVSDRRLIGTNILAPATGLEIGNCYQFKLTEAVSSLLTDGMYAHHFMYRLNVTDLDGIVQTTGDWYNSITQRDIRILNLSADSEPSLAQLSDEELYQLEVYVVTRSGYADIDNPASVSFACTGEVNQPETIIYNGRNPEEEASISYIYNTCWVLGEYHYNLDKPDFLEYYDGLPQETVNGEGHYATPLNIDLSGEYTLIGSDDLKVYLEWGYWGKYGLNQYINPEITNSPYDEEINLLTNPEGTTNYSANVEYYEIQLDGLAPATDFYGSAAEEVESGWLRIRALYPDCEKIRLENLPSGEHVFRVRAADNFGNVDAEPAEFALTIYEYIEPENRDDLLILDLDYDSNFSPDVILDTIYLEAVGNYPGSITQIDLWEQSLSSQEILTNNSKLNFEDMLLARSDLLPYKWIIIHQDKRGAGIHHGLFNNLYDIHTQGSNLIFSAGSDLRNLYNSALNHATAKSVRVFEDYWGIELSEEEDNVECVSQSPLTNPYFIGANPTGDMNFLGLMLPSWNDLVNITQGLGPCCIFNEEGISSNIIYLYDCKPVDAETFPPSLEDYNYLNDKPVAINNVYNSSQSWIFGFSLPYIVPEDLQEMFDDIFTGRR
ncbi:MAG: hypothetical protein RAO94_01080 [Candidatus Stygibacter australis]|nr:hypothetical protein [Candidatus Stygibacter australis]MDP8320921.1 hypothetical protein [Candidatus Stygibacter australis]